MTVIHSHRDLIVWQKSMKLVKAAYAFTEHFPPTELYRLTDQIRRAALSIPANIAEGRRRHTRKDFVRFLFIAYASAAELEAHLEIAQVLKLGPETARSETALLVKDVQRLTNAMITAMTDKAEKLKSKEAL